MAFEDRSPPHGPGNNDDSGNFGIAAAPNDATLRIIELRGYSLLGRCTEPTKNSEIFFLQHNTSGARVVLIHNSDPHLMFEIRYRTLPEDSSGALHKIEHAVIGESAGSQGSVSYDEATRSLFLTNVNATTSPDFTNYFAYGTDRDSIEIMAKCFIDSTLKGVPSSDVFHREHGHLRPAPDKPGGLSFGGVVHGEMIGVYSDPNRWIDHALFSAIFRDGPYSHYAGGEPIAMLDLTEKQFQRTYESFYNPSQASICYYGDIPIEQKLDFISRALETYNRAGDFPSLPPARRDEPRAATVTVPVDQSTPESQWNNQGFRIAWKFETPADLQERFEIEVLGDLLLAESSRPLQRALWQLQSKGQFQGCRRTECGHETVIELRCHAVEPSDVEVMRNALIEALSNFEANGFSLSDIEAVLNSTSNLWTTKCTDPNSGSKILELAQENSLRGNFSIDQLSVPERIEILRKKIAWGEPIFQSLVSKYLLKNPDRTDLLIVPSATAKEERTKLYDAKIAARVAALSETERAEALKLAARIKEDNDGNSKSLENTPAPVATLPDRFRKTSQVEVRASEHNGAIITHQPQPTGGESELFIRFDVSDLSPQQLSTLQFVGWIIDTYGPDGSELGKYSQEIRSASSGANFEVAVLNKCRPDGSLSEQYRVYFGLRSRIEPENYEKFTELLASALTRQGYTDSARMLELAARIESSLLSMLNQSQRVPDLASRNLSSVTNSVGEIFYATGMEYAIQNLRRIKAALTANPEAFFTELRRLHAAVFQRQRLFVSATSDEESFLHLSPHLRRFIDVFPDGHKPQPAYIQGKPAIKLGVVSGDLEVNYVNYRAQLKRDDGVAQFSPGAAVLAHKIIDRHLYVTVRMQGGAYGAASGFEESTNQAVFFSWRDPNIESTIASFKDSVRWLKQAVTDNLLQRAKVSLIKEYEKPSTPFTLGQKGLNRFEIGYSVEMLNAERARIFDTTVEDILRYADALEEAFSGESWMVVYGSRAALEAAVASGIDLKLVSRL